MYYIQHEGVTYEYGTLTDAKAMADYIFRRTGVVVAITDSIYNLGGEI